MLDRKVHGSYTDLSRLFLYKVTRNFIGVTGDTGAEIRSVMGALALFGAPPEDDYPYDMPKYDDEPSAYHYALASNFKGIKYARLDTGSPESLLDVLTSALLKGQPWVFGFTCYSSLDYTGVDGRIAFPKSSERVTGGHAVVAVGFDTAMICPNAQQPGAFLIRNSWGMGWGDHGYGWISFDYIRQGLAVDFWTLTKAAWVDPEQFR
jgi:C1A family cysteine protease